MLSPGPGPQLGLGPHEVSHAPQYLAAAMLRHEEGQILPGLLVVLLALLAVGAMTFQVGKAAVLRSEAQTAADAAALAGAREIRRQLSVQWATLGTTDLSRIDRAAVIAQMDEYARRNGGRVIDRDIVGVDVARTSARPLRSARRRRPGARVGRAARAP